MGTVFQSKVKKFPRPHVNQFPAELVEIAKLNSNFNYNFNLSWD